MSVGMPMSRPWVAAENKNVKPRFPEQMTMNEIIKLHGKNLRRSGQSEWD